jgi:hypothetical protein
MASIAGWGAIGQAEGKTAEGRVGFQHRPDLLQEVVKGSVTRRRRIALLEIDLDLDRMLVVRASEAAERLFRLTRIAVAQDDQPPFRDLLAQHAVALDNGIGDRLEQGLDGLEYPLGLARRHRDHSDRSCCSISAGSCDDQCSAAWATSSRLRSFTWGTSRNITTVVRP